MGLRRFDEDKPKPITPKGKSLKPKHDPGMSNESAHEAVQEMVKASLDNAIDTLLHLAEACIIEERTQGVPGPVWQEFMDKIAEFTGINRDNRVQIILIARLLFLLLRARQMLDGDRIDPGEFEIKD